MRCDILYFRLCSYSKEVTRHEGMLIKSLKMMLLVSILCGLNNTLNIKHIKLVTMSTAFLPIFHRKYVWIDGMHMIN